MLPVKQFAFPSAVFLMRTEQPRPKKSASEPRQSSAGIYFPDGKFHTSVQRATVCMFNWGGGDLYKEHICKSHFSVQSGEEEGNKDKCSVTL